MADSLRNLFENTPSYKPQAVEPLGGQDLSLDEAEKNITAARRKEKVEALKQQLALAAAAGKTEDVANLKAQLDALGEDTSSIAAQVNSYQAGVPAPVPNPDIQQPKGTGELTEVVQKAPGVEAETGPKAPQYKSSYVAPDYEGLTSIEDLFKANEGQREKMRGDLESQRKAETGRLGEEEAEKRKTYQEGKTRNEWLDVAERVAQAAAQYGAARQGLNTNVNMANLPFERADYGKKTALLLDEMKSELESVKERRQEAERRGDKQMASREASLDKSLSAAIRDAEKSRSEREKDAERQSRDIEGENRFAQESYRTAEQGASRRDAAKARAENLGLTKDLAERKFKYQQEEDTKKETAKKEAEAGKQKAAIDKKLGEVDSALEMIDSSDAKLREKGEAKMGQALGELGVSKAQQRELIEAAKPASILKGEFSSDTKRANLLKKLEEVRAGIAQPKAPAAPSAAASFPGAPPVGTVKNGFKYIGGNPADAKSWQKQ